MDAVDIARWQFAITTVYHFFFVPVTIGLSVIVAGFETAWLRHRNPEMLRLTKFFGKLFTINFALGLVTGIVQEFQFGMNWSDYSRFVGDIFGAPLAIEALLAFFLESTFLGLWIFGWDKMPARLHAACMWLVAVGTLLSAYFILAANSFMQHPVGYRFNPVTGRAEMTDFVAVLTNKVQLVTFPHTMTSAYMVGGAFVMAVGLWHLRKPDVGKNASMYRQGHPNRRLGHPRLGARRHGLGRPPGQDHDRGAADEDGRRRGALQLRGQQCTVLAVDDRLAGRQPGEVRRQGAGPAQLPGHRTLRRSRRGHQRDQGRVREAVRRGPRRPACSARATPRPSRSPTGRSGS